MTLMLSIPGLASAGYSDVVTDPTGDVMQATGPEPDDWKFVENPDIDIIRAEISETDDFVIVSLTVKGIIVDHVDYIYEIYLKDDLDNLIDISYSNGDLNMIVYGHYHVDAAVDGVGTDTLSIAFTREQIYEPNDLFISKIETYNEGQAQVDFAGPDAEYPPGYDENGDDNGDDPPENGDDNGDDPPENGDEDDSPGFAFLLMGIALVSAVLIYHKKKR